MKEKLEGNNINNVAGGFIFELKSNESNENKGRVIYRNTGIEKDIVESFFAEGGNQAPYRNSGYAYHYFNCDEEDYNNLVKFAKEHFGYSEDNSGIIPAINY